jgi:hypothetical protein
MEQAKKGGGNTLLTIKIIKQGSHPDQGNKNKEKSRPNKNPASFPSSRQGIPGEIVGWESLFVSKEEHQTWQSLRNGITNLPAFLIFVFTFRSLSGTCRCRGTL